MIEILPVRLLTDEDGQLFGNFAVNLGKLQRAGLPVAPSIAVTAPNLKLKTILEYYDFGSKEVFEQSLTLVKREIEKIPVPENLVQETRKYAKFMVGGIQIKSVKQLWLNLLLIWLEEVKQRLWKEGFYKGLTEVLEPQVVISVKKVESYGSAYFDPIQDDTVINIKQGKLNQNDLKKLDGIVKEANKKLFIPHEYEWIVDLPAGRQGGGVKLTKVLPYTPAVTLQAYTPTTVILNEVKDLSRMRDSNELRDSSLIAQNDRSKSAVRVFLDLSTGLVVEREVDGVFIASEKIFDLNEPRDSFEDLVFRLVESANAFPDSPILFKLADKSEGLPAGRQGMGKVRGTLRLLHQKSLFEPMVDALDFARHKKSLTNVHIVTPFVRGVNEFLQIKRELAVKKLSRKNSLQLWMEVAVPENIINLEDYLVVGLDGVVLNLDELVSFLNGFDANEGELMTYKNEVNGLLKFIEDGLKLLHKSKVPFIAYGSLSLYPQVLDFLIEKGLYGIVVERYEAPSIRDLLHQVERKLVLRKSV